MIQIGLHGGGRMTIHDDKTVDVSAVTPQVLAYGLSYVTRFGGQYGPYSVLDHTNRMYDWAKADGQDKAVLRAIQIHDAPECLGEGDTQRNVKRVFECEGLRSFAKTVTRALWAQYIPVNRPIHEWYWERLKVPVKDYDEMIGTLECRAFGAPHGPVPDWWDTRFAPTLGVYDPPEVQQAGFLRRWRECE